MSEIGIKFNCNWTKEKPLNIELINDLNIWRDKLHHLGLIGAYSDDVGYGNISIRHNENNFIISGTATGKYKKLTNEHYTCVTQFDLNTNTLSARGPIMASSESLTHAVIYDYDNSINAVIHIHHLDLWKKTLNIIPTTNKNIEYGTTDMAMEILRLFKETNLHEEKIFAMAGHEEGLMAFGESLEEAGQKILDLLLMRING